MASSRGGGPNSPTSSALPQIPQFPGQRPPRTAPAPPKFLLISDANGEERKIEVRPNTTKHGGSNGPEAGLHPIPMKQPDFPVLQTRYTTSQPPQRNFAQPPHRYGRAVDSRAESKSSDPIGYAGTSYTKTPNAPSRGYMARPTNPTVPRPFMPLSKEAFAASPALANRTANGAILGSLSTTRYVAADHVPYLAPEVPLGPDNPSKDLNETWSAHWDDEAGAVYYYNKITGEATWISPV
jgi:hypothetical protein